MKHPHPLITRSPQRPARPRLMMWLRRVAWGWVWLALLLITLWAVGALWFDFYAKPLRWMATAVYVVAALVVLVRARGRVWKMGLLAAGFLLVLCWWLTLKPS